MQLKTAGDLRGFLADVLVGIRNGEVDSNQAHAISKVAAQINQSLSTEVQARIHLKGLGDDKVKAGSMVLASAYVRETPKIEGATPDETCASSQVAVATAPAVATSIPRRDGDKLWCEQCELRVTTSQAVGCKSPFCKAKEAA